MASVSGESPLATPAGCDDLLEQICDGQDRCRTVDSRRQRLRIGVGVERTQLGRAGRSRGAACNQPLNVGEEAGCAWRAAFCGAWSASLTMKRCRSGPMMMELGHDRPVISISDASGSDECKNHRTGSVVHPGRRPRRWSFPIRIGARRPARSRRQLDRQPAVVERGHAAEGPGAK